MENKTLVDEVKELIALQAEGDYWDFKQQWHDKNSDLLHDIICMANNLANRDAYIILGVADKSEDGVEVVGVSDRNRKNQQNLIDFLKDKSFAGGIRPTVYVRTVNYCGKKLDVIIIKNSTRTPFYLSKPYGDVYSGNIYTRIGDTNTPKKATADIDKVEYLWRKRFGLDLLPLDKVKALLQNPNNWLPIRANQQQLGYRYYCKQHPEYTILYYLDETRFDKGRVDKVDHDLYWLNRLPRPLHNVYIYGLELNYHSTVLFSTLVVAADTYKFERTLWGRETLFDNHSGVPIFYAYLEKDSIEFLLDEWLCNKDLPKSSPVYSSLKPHELQPEYLYYNPYKVVPVFIDAKEHRDFKKYVLSHREDFLAVVGDIKSEDTYYASPEWIQYLNTVGSTLVEWLEEWRIKLGVTNWNQ